jgi:hypothetical protein
LDNIVYESIETKTYYIDPGKSELIG